MNTEMCSLSRLPWLCSQWMFHWVKFHLYTTIIQQIYGMDTNKYTADMWHEAGPTVAWNCNISLDSFHTGIVDFLTSRLCHEIYEFCTIITIRGRNYPCLSQSHTAYSVKSVRHGKFQPLKKLHSNTLPLHKILSNIFWSNNDCLIVEKENIVTHIHFQHTICI